MVDLRVKMHCDAIVISDALPRSNAILSIIRSSKTTTKNKEKRNKSIAGKMRIWNIEQRKTQLKLKLIQLWDQNINK